MLAPAHAFSAGRSRTEATDALPQLPADLGRSGVIWGDLGASENNRPGAAKPLPL